MRCVKLGIVGKIRSKLHAIYWKRDGERETSASDGAKNRKPGTRLRLFRALLAAMAGSAEASEWYYYNLHISENQTEPPR